MGESLLVVDDDPRLLGVMSIFFELKGFEVRAAEGGVAGLAAIRQARPAVVVLDVMMPDLDGLSVCREIRADPDLRMVPVLILSARDDAASEAAAAGADSSVSKPFDLDHLLNEVMALVNRGVAG